MNRDRWRASAVLVGSGYVLRTFRPQPAELIRVLPHPHVWVATVGPDAAAGTIAGALLWLVALWLTFGMTVTVLALAPGRLGMLASTVARRVTPAVLRRVGIAAAGASILASPAAAFADTTGGSPSASSASAPVRVPSAAAPTPVNRQQESLPPLSWPIDPGPTTTPGAAPTGAAGGQAGTSQQVTVHPGDSLWSIAAQRLSPTESDARIQAEWPRWYAANRRLIGADPNLLRPGTKLRVPQPAPSSTEE